MVYTPYLPFKSWHSGFIKTSGIINITSWRKSGLQLVRRTFRWLKKKIIRVVWVTGITLGVWTVHDFRKPETGSRVVGGRVPSPGAESVCTRENGLENFPLCRNILNLSPSFPLLSPTSFVLNSLLKGWFFYYSLCTQQFDFSVRLRPPDKRTYRPYIANIVRMRWR